MHMAKAPPNPAPVSIGLPGPLAHLALAPTLATLHHAPVAAPKKKARRIEDPVQNLEALRAELLQTNPTATSASTKVSTLLTPMAVAKAQRIITSAVNATGSVRAAIESARTKFLSQWGTLAQGLGGDSQRWLDIANS